MKKKQKILAGTQLAVVITAIIYILLGLAYIGLVRHIFIRAPGITTVIFYSIGISFGAVPGFFISGSELLSSLLLKNFPVEKAVIKERVCENIFFIGITAINLFLAALSLIF